MRCARARRALTNPVRPRMRGRRTGSPSGRNVRDGKGRARREPDLRRRARPSVFAEVRGRASACGDGGALCAASVVILMGGAAIRDALDWGETFDWVWRVARWPLGLTFAVASVALLSSTRPAAHSPRRPGSPSALRCPYCSGSCSWACSPSSWTQRTRSAPRRTDRRDHRRIAVDLPLLGRSLRRARLRGAARGGACRGAGAAA